MITQTCGLGDTFIKDNADAVNKALKRMDAPFFINCVKTTKAKAKRDVYKVGWRRFSEITCATGGHINNRAVKPLELNKWGKKWYGRAFSMRKLKQNPEEFANAMLKLENKTPDGRKITVQKAKVEQKKAKVQAKRAKKKLPAKTKTPAATKAKTATKRKVKKVFILKSLRPKKKTTVIRSLKREKPFSGEKQDEFIKFVQKKFMKLKIDWYKQIRGGKDPRALKFNDHLAREFEAKYREKKQTADRKPAPRPPVHRQEPARPRPVKIREPLSLTPAEEKAVAKEISEESSGGGKSDFEKLMEFGR